MTPEELRLVRQKLPIGETVARLSCPALRDEAVPLEKKQLTTPGINTDEAKLNKLERAYLAYLRAMEFPWIGVQNVTLKLANDCRLTVDFVVMGNNGSLRFIDVKGFQREDALIKMKVAARMFPFWNFEIVKRKSGIWIHTSVKP